MPFGTYRVPPSGRQATAAEKAPVSSWTPSPTALNSLTLKQLLSPRVEKVSDCPAASTKYWLSGERERRVNTFLSHSRCALPLRYIVYFSGAKKGSLPSSSRQTLRAPSARIFIHHSPLSIDTAHTMSSPQDINMNTVKKIVTTEQILVHTTSCVASCSSLFICPAMMALDTATGVPKSAISVG